MEVMQLSTDMPEPAKRPEGTITLQLADGMLEHTQLQLRQASGGVREAIVLWAGRAQPGGAFVSHLLMPRFESGSHWLTIPADERAVVTQYIRRERLLLFADLHTHPEEAFLSDADIVRPLSGRPGFYAGVLPSFALGPVGDGWRLFESHGLRGWAEVSITERVHGRG